MHYFTVYSLSVSFVNKRLVESIARFVGVMCLRGHYHTGKYIFFLLYFYILYLK